MGRGKVKPQSAKVVAAAFFPTPETKKQVCTFPSLAGYYLHFQLFQCSSSLTNLTKKTGPNQIVWSPEYDKAFNKLKTLIYSGLVLRTPDFNLEFVLQTDTSKYSARAVLTQVDENGEEHPNAYFSRKLLPREVK